jgi:predicted O-methyltransferase YrrM
VHVLSPAVRAKILESRFLPLVVFPYRLRLIVKFQNDSIKRSLSWLFGSKEFANFTYDLTPKNKAYLAWFIANVCGTTAQEISQYFDELESNSELRDYIQNRLNAHRRGNEIDDQAFYGRRLGWYAIVRALKPTLVVETGTEKGLGSLVLAEALCKNDRGQLITIDMEPSSGLLIGERYAGVIERVIGDSLQSLRTIEQIDLFIHDSDHSAEHEAREFELIESRLSRSGIVLSDNSHATEELAKWSKSCNRKFFYFAEEPYNHWYPGAGIGISLPS